MLPAYTDIFIYIKLFNINNNMEKQELAPEIAKDIEIQKTHQSVLDICDKFKYEIMRCINCPIILECTYPKRRLTPLKTEATKMSKDVYEEEIELDNSAENILRAQNKRDYVYNQFIKDNAHKNLLNDRCLYERKEILNALQKFVEAGYDIADPRVYLIVNELIGNILTSGRSNKAFTNLGVLLKKDTPAGPIYYSNPLLKVKVEFSKLIIEATEALDRILKSDETIKAEKNFTAHLLKQLGIRDKKKQAAIKKITSHDVDVGTALGRNEEEEE